MELEIPWVQKTVIVNKTSRGKTHFIKFIPKVPHSYIFLYVLHFCVIQKIVQNSLQMEQSSSSSSSFCWLVCMVGIRILYLVSKAASGITCSIICNLKFYTKRKHFP